MTKICYKKTELEIMKFKKIMLIALLLLAVLTIGAASAADDVDALAVEDTGDEAIAEAPADEEIVEVSADNLVADDDSTSEEWDVFMERNGVHFDNLDDTVIRVFWPDDLNASDKYVQIYFNGTKEDEINSLERPNNGNVTITGGDEKQKIITFGDLGIYDSQFTQGKYTVVVKHDSSILLTFDFSVEDERYNWDLRYDRNDEYNYFEPGLFNFTPFTTEVDFDYLNDNDVELFSVVFPYREDKDNLTGNEYIYTTGVGVVIEDRDFTTDRYHYWFSEVDSILKEDSSPDVPRIVTLNELIEGRGIEPGIYEVKVYHDSVVGRMNLRVTKEYTGEDFVGIASYDITEPDDPVCVIVDDTKSGLNGTVTIFVNGAQVYSKELFADQGEHVNILFSDLTGSFYNGDYALKVVYEKSNYMNRNFEKSNGKVFSAEGNVSFEVRTDLGNIPTTITASDVTTVYGANKNLVATLKDVDGKPISGVDVYIDIMGVKYPITTDKSGRAIQSLVNLPPGKHNVVFSLEGNDKYMDSSKTVKVNVNKATPKLTAKAKTFKKSDKTKKYTITLKTNQNKVMKNAKVTLNVNKKTYTAKTNSKGVATFKLTKLTKKGKYTATVKYGGNSYYNAKTVKPKITVK